MAKRTDAQGVKPEAQPSSSPRKVPALEAFFRIRRLDTWNFIIERVEVDTTTCKVTEACKPDLRRIVLGKLQEILLG